LGVELSILKVSGFIIFFWLVELHIIY